MSSRFRHIPDSELQQMMAPRKHRLMAHVVRVKRADVGAEPKDNGSGASKKAATDGRRSGQGSVSSDAMLWLQTASKRDEPVTRIGFGCGLPPDRAAAARRECEEAKLIETFKLTLGSRVGGNVMLAMITEVGWRCLRRRPALRRSASVGAAHWWCQLKAHAFYREQGFQAEIEGELGGKAADVAIHKSGEVLALEIEMSGPNRSLSNIVRDLKAGFSRVLTVAGNIRERRTIEAQLAGHLTAAQRAFVEVKALSDCDFVRAYLDTLSGRVRDNG